MKKTKLRMKRACDVPLSAMTKVEGGHHCHQCDKMVYDLRRSTREEAEALFRGSEATPCVRFIPDQNGFAILRSAAAVGAALLATTGAAACDEVKEGLDHAAHLGFPHGDEHTEDYGLAGEPMMVEDLPPETETGTETETETETGTDPSEQPVETGPSEPPVE